MTKEHDKAIDDLHTSLILKPDDKDAKEQLKELQKKPGNNG